MQPLALPLPPAGLSTCSRPQPAQRGRLPRPPTAARGIATTARSSVAAAAGRREGGAGDWYEAAPAREQRRDDGAESQGQQQRRHYYDSTPRRPGTGGGRGGRGGRDGGRSQQQRWRDAEQWGRDRRDSRDSRGSRFDAEAVADDGPGWWEVPREQRAAQQAAAAAAAAAQGLDLEPWQEQQLLLAAGGSKKKAQVQTLAANLGLDRSEVLAWMAAFRAKPKPEQARLLGPLASALRAQQASPQAQQASPQAQQASPQAQQAPLQAQKQSRAQRAAAYDPWGPEDEDEDELDSQGLPPSSSSSSSSGGGGGLPFSAPGPNTGFVPFLERRGAAGPRARRLPAEVLRTLEGVYGRGPWPNKEVVAGLYELHRLPREVVLEWFAARRDMDGLPHNPRHAKASGIRTPAAAAADDAAAAAPLAGGARPAAPAGQAAAQPAGPSVSRLTARELAALRSSLPSPRKLKGAKLAEELGIKQGAAPGEGLEIGGVAFVPRDGAAAWRGAWRRRRAGGGLPAQRLDFGAWFVRRQQG